MDRPQSQARDTSRPSRSAVRGGPLVRHRWPLFFVVLGGAAFVAANALAHSPYRAPVPLPLALVMPLTGPRSAECAPMVKALEMRVEELNSAGGIAGHRIRLLKFDDKDDPVVARRVAKEVAASPALAVIGHFSNDTTSAACQVYRDAGLLAVGATATYDRLPVDNPYFYRLCCDDTAQGWAMAVYTSRVLKSTRASILYSNEESGLSQLGAFKKTYPIVGGEIANRWVYDAGASVEERLKTIEQVAQAVKDETAGVVLMAISPASVAREALVSLRRMGCDPVIFGNSTMGTEAFAESLRPEPEEQKEPGYFTKRAYATTFVILDTANDRMSAFVADYRKAFDKAPPPRSVKYSEAAMVLADALRRANPAGTKVELAADRRKVRDQVAALDGPKHAFEGITGPLYFDEYQTLPEPARITRFVKGELSSAPLQIAAVRNPELLDLEKEVDAGNIFPFGVRYFWTQQVVFTGIDFREISAIDPAKGTFNADFYLWFRYAGSDAILQIDLNAAGDKAPYDPQTPIAAKEVNGMKYRLYNVKGAFDADLDFHNYPFDSQTLQLQLSNPRLPRESVIYAIDSVGLKLPRRPGDAFRVLAPPNWNVSDVRYAPDTRRTSSTRGDPGRFDADYETEFSGFKAVVQVQRLTRDFLFKQLVPLVLLIVVVFLSLHFPQTMTNERVGVAISSLLASAVLQSGMTAQLSGVGYSTAIEYGFYGFFVMCVFCVGVALLIVELNISHRPKTARKVELAARWVYLSSIVGAFVVYYLSYGAG